VLSTVHTSDAVSAISRLVGLDLGYDTVASVLLGVLSQRLVRRVCRHCAETDLPDTKIRKLFGDLVEGIEFVKGAGCDRCNHTGYRGRIGLFELFVVDEAIQQAIQIERPLSEIVHMARENGMRPLVMDGVMKVKHKLTTLEEIMRVVPYRQIVSQSVHLRSGSKRA